MQVYRLGDLDANDLRGPVVYAVKNAAGVLLYVGKTKDVHDRLYCHRHNSSPLGRELRIAREAVWDWTVTIYQLADCTEAVRKHRSWKAEFYEQSVAEDRALDRCLREAEQAMIKELQPALNLQWW
jgi:predicted GIY-YIG superfamily endonuclease